MSTFAVSSVDSYSDYASGFSATHSSSGASHSSSASAEDDSVKISDKAASLLFQPGNIAETVSASTREIDYTLGKEQLKQIEASIESTY